MKDLVEHIRSIHFVVLAIALGIMVALQFETQPAIQRAAQDAEAILRLSERWQQVPSDLALELDRRLREDFDNAPSRNPNDGPGFADDRRITPVGNFVAHMRVAEHNPNLRKMLGASGPDGSFDLSMPFSIHSSWLNVSHVGGQPYAQESLPQPHTLGEFTHFWDQIRDKQLTFAPLLFKEASYGDQKCRNLTPDSSNAPKGRARLLYKLIGMGSSKVQVKPELVADLAYKDVTAHNDRSVVLQGGAVYICGFAEVSEPEITPHLGRAFAHISPEAERWGDGKSSDVFTELLESAKYLEDTPLKSLAASLRQRAEMNSESVEIFQTKIPATAIPIYGSALLLITFLYLLTQLQELRRIAGRGGLDEPYGYVGLYPNPLATRLTETSLILFPLIPCAIELRHGTGYLTFVSGSALVIALALGILCARELHLARVRVTPKTETDAA